jgi:hypothetical protein
VVPHGQYKWLVLPFGLRNAPSEFQKMEDVFSPLDFVITYIADILVCSYDTNQHKKHLEEFFSVVFRHDLALSENKMEIGKTKIEFLGLVIYEGKVELQTRVLQALAEFPDRILEKTQLQRFLGRLNFKLN